MFYAIYKLDNNKYQIVNSNSDNKIKKKIIEYKPCLYIEDESGKYKDFYGKRLKKVVFNNEYEYSSALKEYKKKNIKYCGDIAPKYQALAHNIENIDFNIKPVIAYNYDIEAFNLENDNYSNPLDADNPIQSITIQNMITNKYMVFGYNDYEVTDIHRYDDKGNILFTVYKENIKYIKCDNENQLLRRFIKLLTDNVNVIVGYNILYYDNTYIISRCRKLNIEKEFVENSSLRSDSTEFGFMQNIDSYPCIKKFKNDTLENNQLNTVSKAYLGYGKIEFSESFRELYLNDYKKFLDYNIIDVALVYELEKKLGIIKLMFNMNNRFFCNPVDTMSLTTYVDTAIYKDCLDNNIIIPCKTKKLKESYVGGFVMEPLRGISDYGFCIDLESSYPNNIGRYNISPETLVDYSELPEELLEKVLVLKFKIAKDVYKEYKQYYRTKDGDLKFDKNCIKVSHENCALHFNKTDEKKNNEVTVNKLAFPRFFIDYSGKEVDDEIFSSEINKSVKLLFVMNQEQYSTYLSDRIFNKNIFAMYEMLITEKLIDFFVEDHNRFKEFSADIKNQNLTMTPNLQFFRKDKIGIITKFVKTNFQHRVSFKNLGKDISLLISAKKNNDKSLLDSIKNKEFIEEYCNKSLEELSDIEDIADTNDATFKRVINGTYGFLAAISGRYYNKHLGESITSAGQLAASGFRTYMRKTLKVTDIYQDTDSIDGIITKEIHIYDEIMKNKHDNAVIVNLILDWYNSTVLPLYKKYFNTLKDLCNCCDTDLKFDLETIMKSQLFTDKKKYAWQLIYSKGTIYPVGKEKFKHKGLNFVKSDTPPWCRPKLKKFTELALTTRDEKLLKAYIMKCRKVYESQDLLTIGKPVGVKTFNDYAIGDSAIPAGVDAAMCYNTFIEDQGLKQYNKIGDGNKIKWVYINPRNSYKFDKIAIMEDGAIEEIKKYFEVDYEKQWQTTFMSLPERIFEVCGWNLNSKKSMF